MLSEEIYKQVIKLVSQDRTESAIGILQEQMEADPDRDANTYHSVILLISQYRNWENQRRANLNTDVSELNRINKEILDIAKDLAKPEQQLKVPAGYQPPPVLPKADPLEVAQQPMGHQPIIQRAVPAAPSTNKKEVWATPTRILAVVGGLFLAILAITLIFPDDDVEPVNSDSPVNAFSAPISSTFNYVIPTEYPNYGGLETQIPAYPDGNGELFIKNLLSNSSWRDNEPAISESITINCNSIGTACNVSFSDSGSVELLSLMGFADDGYAYFKAPSEQGVPQYYAIEFVNNLSTLRMYVLDPAMAANTYPTLDFVRQ
ncbi:MAG: hypothetical protein AAF433_01910 [Bacteroidota bacterium]